MTQYKSISELKNTAKNTLDGKYSGAVLILFLSSLIYSAADLIISFVGTVTSNTAFYVYGDGSRIPYTIGAAFDYISLAADILLGVMTAGIALYFLKIACGQSGSLNDLFYGFKVDSRKILTISAATTICHALCFGPFQYFADKYLNYDYNKSKWLILMLVAFAIGICLYLLVSLGISLSFFFMLDFPEKSAKETLALCWHKMKGHRVRLFLLELSFLPLMLLCILSFGIGFLWLNPYMQMTYSHFFLDLMNPSES